MFCNNCGNQLNPEARFCNGCGAPVAGAAPATQPVPTVTSHATSIVAKNFRCNGCGESLEIPQNPRGIVKCKFCGNESVLDGIIKNAEIAAKENINSGIPLSAFPATLHQQLVKILSESSYIPLDVFDKIEVVREERYCVPAYCFEYNGDAPFSYEEGKQDTRQEKGFSGDNETITTIKEVKWHTERGTASVSGTLFISGNKKMAPYINEMYIETDHNQFIDFEYLEFPPDVKTLEYDLPQLTAFNEHIKPIVDDLLYEEGKKALQGTSYEQYIPRGGAYGVTYTRDFKMSGSKIQKEITRVFLGLYRLVYKYGEKEYEMWATGDGERVLYDDLPEDMIRKQTISNRKETLAEKKKEYKKMPTSNKGCLITFFVVSIIALLVLSGIIINTVVNEYWMFERNWPELIIPLCIILIINIICIVLLPSTNRKGKEREEKRAKVLSEINAFETEFAEYSNQPNIVAQQFKSHKKALRGIYEKVSGDASAF